MHLKCYLVAATFDMRHVYVGDIREAEFGISMLLINCALDRQDVGPTLSIQHM